MSSGLRSAVRNHWSIENQLHWVLDVGFNEDSSKGCQGYSAENLAVRDLQRNKIPVIQLE